MSRKILSLIVAVAFVLTTISTAFAASLPSDVTGDYSQAVSKVQSLNIMVGDAGTGLFRPDDVIKRSEFAVIAVKAMGLNDSAIISKGSTKFTDVSADHWASGYINVAVGAGLINGYPDGTYQPDKTINYAEAITILGNMLGYGPVLAGKPWPGAYVAQATTSGITSGVVMAPTVGATRGNVAKLVSNTLESKIVKVDTYDINGKPTYKVGTLDTDTLISQKLSITPISVGTAPTTCKEFTVTGTPDMQNGATVGKSTLQDTSNYAAAQQRDFVDGLNPNDYLGLKINAWENSDHKIAVAQITNAASDVYDGIVSKDGLKLKLDGKSASYDFVTAPSITFNATGSAVGVSFNSLAGAQKFLAALGSDKAMGRVVLSDGKVSFVNVYGATDVNTGADPVDNTFTVKEIRDGYIRSIGGAYQDIKIDDVKGDISTKAKRYSITKNGVAATIDDIKANDVVTRVQNGNYIKLIASSSEVTGTLSAVSGTGIDATLTIGGKDYTIVSANKFSYDNGDNWATKTNINDITTVVGKDVTVELTAAGQIAYLNCATTASTYYYGIIRNFAANVGANLDYAVSLYKQDGTKVAYTFDKTGDIGVFNTTDGAVDVKYTGGAYAELNKGDLVQYQLTSDGKIKEMTLTRADKITNDGTYYAATSNAGHDNSTPASNAIVIAGTTAVISSTSTIFSINDLMATNGDVGAVQFSTIDGQGSTTYKAIVKDGLVKALSVNIPALAGGTSGVVVGTGFDSDGRTVTLNVNGTAKTYKVALAIGANGAFDTTFNALAKGIYIDYNVDANGKIASFNTPVNNNAFFASTAAAHGISTFKVLDPAIFRIMSIDSVNKIIKVENVNAGYSEYGKDYYFRYDPANLNVYDATGKGNTPVTIVGGKDMSALSAYDYVWIGGANATGYDFSRIVKIAIGDLTDNAGNH